MSEYNTLTFERKGSISIITLNRPKQLNALSVEMIEELLTVFDNLMDDYDCKVVVLTGAGKGFCSGADLKNLSDFDYSDLKGRTSKFYNIQKKVSRMVEKMRQIPQPIIAAVNGLALGGGLALTLPADIRIASENAKFCAAFINVGMTGADMGTSYFLPKIVGLTRASEILLTGRFVDAEEALQIGLVTKITENEDVMNTAMKMADLLSEKSFLGLTLTKEALTHSFNNSLEGVVTIENRNQTLAGLSGSWEEAIEKFLYQKNS